MLHVLEFALRSETLDFFVLSAAIRELSDLIPTLYLLIGTFPHSLLSFVHLTFYLLQISSGCLLTTVTAFLFTCFPFFDLRLLEILRREALLLQ